MLQTQALDIMKLGHNVFLTGEPGAGKTYTLNQFIEYCRQAAIGVGITASTGIAATHIGGMTIHSWSGVGIKDYLNAEQLERLAAKPQLASRFKKTRILIIDEVSMLDGGRLDLINQVCKVMKRSEKPFGGLQVILCGDLFQLPPVTRYGAEINFAHHSAAWSELNLKVCYLTEQYRQDEDRAMLELLRQIRRGEVGSDSRQLLNERLAIATPSLDTTRLYSHNTDVDSLNQQRLDLLKTDSHLFTMEAKGNEVIVAALKKSCLAPETLELKVGAQVLCVANKPAEGYYNGTRGEIIDFEYGRPVVKLLNGKEIVMERHTWSIEDGERLLAQVEQYPLRLAWAITVHKSQGMSLDAAEIDLSRAFMPGMGYVALSRLRTLDGLYLRGVNQTALQVSDDISQYDQILQSQSQKVITNLLQLPSADLSKLQASSRTNLSYDYAEYDKELFKRLRTWRLAQAAKQKLPPYMVFDDKTLVAFAAEQPASSGHLIKIPGIGPKKLDQYGSEVLTLINQHTGKLF